MTTHYMSVNSAYEIIGHSFLSVKRTRRSHDNVTSGHLLWQ